MIPNICTTSGATIPVSGSITVPLPTCEARSHVSFGFLSKFGSGKLLEGMYIDRHISLIYLAEKQNVPYHTKQVHLPMVQKAGSEFKAKK